jgi:glycosyltransferase involved in cell wall biosynthesis
LSVSISVAMCTFNGSRFLPAQLQSIRGQGRLPEELVICDDRSTDGTEAIISDFAQDAPFAVRVVRNNQNLGSTRNFEKAISLCEGNIVALADQDDVWYPYKLQQIERAFLGPNPPVAAFSDADLIDENSRPQGRLWHSFLFRRREQTRFANGDALKILIKHPVVTGATLAFRREFFSLLSPIPADQVHDTWIAFLLAACGRVLPLAQPLMQYRKHTGQQIGPGHATLLDRFRQAEKTGPEFYRNEIARFREISQRLKERYSDFPDAACAVEEIEKKISHREFRAGLPRAGGERIPRIVREMANGGYWHYSEGWQSIAKDMVGIAAKRNLL